MTRTIATKLGCYPFKTECTDAMDAMYWYTFSLLFTFHLRRNQLCLREYSSKRTFRHHFVCNSSFMWRESTHVLWDALSVCMHFSVCAQKNRTELSSLLRRQIYPYVCSSLTPTYWHFLTFYAPCSKCILAYVPRVSYVRTYPPMQQIRSEWISSKIIPP